jgi:hypothetical protein
MVVIFLNHNDMAKSLLRNRHKARCRAASESRRCKKGVCARQQRALHHTL